MSEEKKSFTIKDRRHFTAEGEARSEEREEAESVAPHTPLPAHPPPDVPRSGSKSQVDFAGFIVSLGAQAGFLLSPEEGGPHLEEARQMISILEMLKDKTEGRRTGREEEVLSQVLYELRMAYVAHSPKGVP
jgi:hypothetical protein